MSDDLNKNKDLAESNKDEKNPSTVIGSKSSSNNILVNTKQRGNPLLTNITKVGWEFSDIVPDYVMGATTCALFLSLRYHLIQPDYIHERIKKLGQQYLLRVLLVQVDTKDPHHALKHLTRVCILTNLTLMLAWNASEAASLIETYKMFEKKPPDLIMQRDDNSPYQKIMSTLTRIASVNKSDAAMLLFQFGTLEKIIKANMDELSLCPGIGPQKAQRIFRALRQPFRKECNKNQRTKQNTTLINYLDPKPSTSKEAI